MKPSTISSLFSIFLLTLSGCAYGVSTDMPRELPEIIPDAPYKALPEPVEKESLPARHCTLVGVRDIKDCQLLELVCDGEPDYALICPIRDMGAITNPPRPVVPLPL